MTKKTIISAIAIFFLLDKYISKKLFHVKKVKRILLVLVKTAGVGNIILMTPLIRSLQELNPDIKLTFLVRTQKAAQIIYDVTGINDVIIFPDSEKINLFGGIVFFRNKIRKYKFGMLINTALGSEWYFSFWAMFAGIRWRVGYSRGIKSAFETFSVADNDKEHQVRRHLKVLDTIGIKKYDDEISVKIEPSDRNFAKKYMEEKKLCSNRII